MEAEYTKYSVVIDESARFTTEEAEQLTAGCEVIQVKKGHVLYNAGEDIDCVYFLRKGKAKYHVIYADGSNRNTAFSVAPNFLGVINILPASKTINCCTAVTACELVICPSELFLKRVEQYGLTMKLLRFSVETSRHIHTTMANMMGEEQAKLVDSLRNKQGMTLQETADFLGCSRMQVSRILKHLKEKQT